MRLPHCPFAEVLTVVSMMFWISAKLTLVMLCVVPPVSLFAVSCDPKFCANPDANRSSTVDTSVN